MHRGIRRVVGDVRFRVGVDIRVSAVVTLIYL